MTNPALTTLDVRHEGPVTRVFLNRPEVRNAFNQAVVAELTQVFAALSGRADLRAVVLGGHGKAFCAGADLAWMQAMAGYGPAENLADAENLAEMLWALHQCPVPLVGRIHGDCYAGGMGLAAVCDIRVAAAPAQFCLSEVRLGLAPCTISPYVVRALGEQASRRYAVTGERFDAVRAQALGFVHEACAPDALDATVEALVATLVANGPQATRACKQLVRDVAGRDITGALRADTARRMAEIRAGDEAREGVKAFLQKRPPAWLLPSPDDPQA